MTPANAARMVKIPMKARILVALVVLALLPALAVLTAMAYASPPDPAWVSGFFDDGDQDDVVVLEQDGGGGRVAPFTRKEIVPKLERWFFRGVS